MWLASTWFFVMTDNIGMVATEKCGCSAGCASPGHIKIAHLGLMSTHVTTLTLND